ncbi:MAG: hypothetical protein ACRD5B_02700 [Nitrososphaeraceae archaeon]
MNKGRFAGGKDFGNRKKSESYLLETPFEEIASTTDPIDYVKIIKHLSLSITGLVGR